jgi:hypothetical protein
MIPEMAKVIDGFVKELLLMFSKEPLSVKEALIKLANMLPKNKLLQEAIKEMRDFNHFAKVFGIVDIVRHITLPIALMTAVLTYLLVFFPDIV